MKEIELTARDITGEAEESRRKQLRRVKRQYMAIGALIALWFIYLALP